MVTPLQVVPISTASINAAIVAGWKRWYSSTSVLALNRKLPEFHNKPAATYSSAFAALGFSAKQTTEATPGATGLPAAM